MDLTDLKSPEECVRDAYPTKVHALRLSDMQKFLAFNGVDFDAKHDIKDDLIPKALRLHGSGSFKIPPPDWRLDVSETVAQEATPEIQADPVEPDLSTLPILSLRKAIKEFPGFSWDETQGLKKVEILERWNGRNITDGNE
jgi:hypothetical protein|tara:strand:- start:1343 stop:1765 length:423 start_codon:yes stop_codon:yes gene_type:complete